MAQSTLSKVLMGLLGLLVAVSIAWGLRVKARRLLTPESRMEAVSVSAADCTPSTAININIEKLSSDGRESYEASSKLMEWAKESSNCRKEIISQLIRAMELRLDGDHASFALWSKGSAMLGELKAEEALDLLINHLDFNDGLFSASMVHQPVVLGIQKMGIVAVPKLAIALHHHPKRDVRLAVVLCLTGIGGTEAIDALKDAFNSETDQCVRDLITLTLPSHADKAKPHRPLSVNDGELLRERIRAFRCGN